MKEEIKIN